jgi:hypothetical protein
VHTTAAGAPCERHAPRADDLIGPATLGTTCFAALHDLASGLQAIGAAVDELDAAAGTDPRLRALIEAVTAANARAIAMFVAIRETIRDPGRRREPIELSHLVGRAVQRARQPVAPPAVPPGQVVVAVPVIAQVLTSLLDAAGDDHGARGAAISVTVDGATAAIAIRAAEATPAPASIGATLAIAARAVGVHAGSVQCGEHAGRAEYVVRLPIAGG